MPEETCEVPTVQGDAITGLNCAGYGSSIVVTATFGMLAAAQVLRNLAVQQQDDEAAQS